MDVAVKMLASINKKRDAMNAEPGKLIDDRYTALKQSGQIQCNDDARIDKEMKIDRILSVTEFPAAKIEFRPVKISAADLTTMEKDWEYSNNKNIEVARMFCFDPAKNVMRLSTSRNEGGEESVATMPEACDNDFPGTITLGGFHTHPQYLDKPLDSLGDVIAFGTNDETFSCTGTRWGIKCMYRTREPSVLFDIPRLTKKNDPVYNKDGTIIYDAKSDIVDWLKAMDYADRGVVDSVFIASLGDVNKRITSALLNVPWFKPAGKRSPVDTVESPFAFGKERSSRKTTGNFYCESYIDVINKDAKIRTICDDGKTKGDPAFYVESPLSIMSLMFYSKTGFPTNIYIDEKISGDVEKIRVSKENAKYASYRDEKRDGYHETRAEKMAKTFKIPMTTSTVKSGAIFVRKGKDERGQRTVKHECEYLLLPLPEGERRILGKPAGILCAEKRDPATSETCALISTA
jgi:hypothetical protein